MNDEQVVKVSLDEISKPLLALLVYSKKRNIDFSWRAIEKNVLAHHFYSGKDGMRFKDVLHVLLNLYKDAVTEPRFAIRYASSAWLEVIFSPIEGFTAIEWPGPKSIDDSYTVEQFYSAMIKQVMSDLRIAKVNWLENFPMPE